MVDETLRMYAPAYTTKRVTVSPVVLSTGVTIPEDTYVSIPIAFVHRDPQNWPDEPGASPVRDRFELFFALRLAVAFNSIAHVLS